MQVVAHRAFHVFGLGGRLVFVLAHAEQRHLLAVHAHQVVAHRLAGVEGVDDELFGVLVVGPAHQIDREALQAGDHLLGAMVERLQVGRAHLQRPAQLGDEELGVGVDFDRVGMGGARIAQAPDQGRVFGDVVGRVAKVPSAVGEHVAGIVAEDEPAAGRPRVAARRAADEENGIHYSTINILWQLGHSEMGASALICSRRLASIALRQTAQWSSSSVARATPPQRASVFS